MKRLFGKGVIQTIVFGLLIFASLETFAQPLRPLDTLSTFGKFRSYFLNHESSDEAINKERQIPVELYRKVLGNKLTNEKVPYVEAFKMFDRGKSFIFIVELGCPGDAGGYCFSYVMISTTDDGKVENSKYIGSSWGDLGGGTNSRISLINDSLLEVQDHDIENDDDGNPVKDTIDDYSYYVINNHGFRPANVSEPSDGRLYPQASLRVLTFSELKQMNEDELDVMRNEIFADHGYIFKTQKWKSYFESQSWYRPRFDDVTNKLSVVERINVERILKTS
ncbi:YARHG domain-containing protein [Prolixibacter denitrificans]|uniref:YARHG domain-containing protein n=1 Tax=Prolixibacter denitrificans TaxID=1541063 RepID=A0A2P8CBE9_9BACT|nr:YARHG domain-containing protein [Prolixibacter denitrificans]PSK82300.1 YARHG domain-containing protein [Prolixibacter denitrificans]GET22951.1 hypothetical protein JCM18694_31970 [Prolixibacter denitrificans]